VWPDTQPGWKYVDRRPNEDAEQKAARVYRKLLELDPAAPAIFRFASDAQRLFVAYLGDLETKVRADQLHPAIISHLSKYRKLMPALALLFELADWAAGEGEAGSVSLQHAQQAAQFCDYLESQAKRVYSCITTPQLRAARELGGKIKDRWSAPAARFQPGMYT